MRALEDVLERNPGFHHACDVVTALALPGALNARALSSLQSLSTLGRIDRQGGLEFAARTALSAVDTRLTGSDARAMPCSTAMVRVKRCNACGQAVVRRLTQSASEPPTDAEREVLDAHAAACWPSLTAPGGR